MSSRAFRRGDIVTVAASGDYGKPRLAVVIQSDRLDSADSVLVCLITSTLRDAPLYRLPLQPGPETGLRESSQVMIDKIVAIRRDKVGGVIGRAGEAELLSLGRMLAVMIGIAD